MFIEENTIAAKSATTETCCEISEDILRITLLEDYPHENPPKTPLTIDNCSSKHCLKTGESLCNCTQTGEVKILVKKLTDLTQHGQQQITKNKNHSQMQSTIMRLVKIDSTTDTNDFSNVNSKFSDGNNITYSKNNINQTAQVLITNDTCQDALYLSTDICHTFDVCQCQATEGTEQNSINAQQDQICQNQIQNCSCIDDICHLDATDSCSCQLINNGLRMDALTETADEREDCQNIVIRDVSIQDGQIFKENIEEMSDFLAKACEKRHLKKLCLQDPPLVVPEDYQIDETSLYDPFANILEQGDHIMDTFHNLLTDNGNLTVRISFSYCAKLLAVLLTFNTIFFSKILIWDSFLQHLF